MNTEEGDPAGVSVFVALNIQRLQSSAQQPLPAKGQQAGKHPRVH